MASSFLCSLKCKCKRTLDVNVWVAPSNRGSTKPQSLALDFFICSSPAFKTSPAFLCFLFINCIHLHKCVIFPLMLTSSNSSRNIYWSSIKDRIFFIDICYHANCNVNFSEGEGHCELNGNLPQTLPFLKLKRYLCLVSGFLNITAYS